MTTTQKRLRYSKMKRQRNDLLIMCIQALRDYDRMGQLNDNTIIGMRVAVKTATQPQPPVLKV